MTQKSKRKLADGREVDVGKNRGLRKICACAKRNWTKCPHSWHFSFRWLGRDYRFSIDRHLRRRVESKGDAEAEAERLRVAIRAGEFEVEVPEAVPVERVPVGATFKELADLWSEREHTGRGRMLANEKARTKNLGAIELLPGRLLGTKPIDAICEDDLETAIQRLRERGSAASTLNHYIQTLRSMQRWALRKGHLRRPWLSAETSLKRKRAAQRHRRLTPDIVDAKGKVKVPGEEKRLLAAASKWLQRLIIAALETCCRRGELLSLQWGSVDFARGEITIRAENAKSGKARVLPISPRLLAVLEMVRKEKDAEARLPNKFVFGDEEGNQIGDPKTAWQICVLKAHGYTPTYLRESATSLDPASRRRYREIDLHFHDLRHEAGSRLVEAGWPVHHVQIMLGHADLQTTSIYLNVTRSGLADSMRRFGNAPVLQVVASGPESDPRPPRKGKTPPAPHVSVN